MNKDGNRERSDEEEDMKPTSLMLAAGGRVGGTGEKYMNWK